MNWKENLLTFEHNQEWDLAIAYMQDVITKNPNSLDAYLSINYLLMNLLVEENYDEAKQDCYENLLKKYFRESYEKFAQNAEYLFFTGVTAFMSEWYFGIDIESARKMLKEAATIDNNNALYQWGYYAYLDMSNPKNEKLGAPYAQLILENNSSTRGILKSKGLLGEYILDLITNWYQHSKQGQ